MNTALSNKPPEVIHDTASMQQRCLDLRREGKQISFVPTMGYLHEGHLSLMRAGKTKGDVLILSIFVNPTQFGPNEDLDSYPRDLDRDLELAATVGVDLVYAPLPQDVYPQGYATTVNVNGLTETLCGASRPKHFEGVTTVVNKLFNIIQPDTAFFGQKDFQQLAVIRKMVNDLNIPVEIVGLPIVREEDGLAMSSRNVNLSAAQRASALSLSQSINQAKELAHKGETNVQSILAAVRTMIEAMPETAIDYLQVCHQLTLADQTVVDRDSVLLLAVKVGTTRLIDNSFLLD